MILHPETKPEVAAAAHKFVQRYLYDRPFTNLARTVLNRVPGWTGQDAHEFRRLVIWELMKLNQSTIRTGSAKLILDGEPPSTPKPFPVPHKLPFLPVMTGATVVTKSR